MFYMWGQYADRLSHLNYEIAPSYGPDWPFSKGKSPFLRLRHLLQESEFWLTPATKMIKMNT